MNDLPHAVHLEGGDGRVIEGNVRIIEGATLAQDDDTAKGRELGASVSPNIVQSIFQDVTAVLDRGLDVKFHISEARQASTIEKLTHMWDNRTLVKCEGGGALEQQTKAVRCKPRWFVMENELLQLRARPAIHKPSGSFASTAA